MYLVFKNRNINSAIPNGYYYRTQCLSGPDRNGYFALEEEKASGYNLNTSLEQFHHLFCNMTGMPAIVIVATPPGSTDPFLAVTAGNTSSFLTTVRGFQIAYDTDPGDFVVFGLTYDDFGTNPVVETLDVSGTSELVLGVTGNVSQIKIVATDGTGAQATVILDGILFTTEQFWTISLALFTGIDLTQLVDFVFVIEGVNIQGDLEINLS